MLNRLNHEFIMKNILKDIYSNPHLQSSICLKGGTCLYLFYELDRFSVDLDFNLVSQEFNSNLLTNILEKYINIEDFTNKYFTWFWLGGYEKGSQKIKIEISKIDYPDSYINQSFYGLTIPIMSTACMFAHKLCAITDRTKLQNRDLYDANFMFSKMFDIDDNIIKTRTGLSTKDYLNKLVEFIEIRKDRINILEGLGELISDSQKDKIKNGLINELITNIKIRIDTY